MPRLLYVVDYSAAPLDLAAQAIAILRLQEFARRTGLRVEESRLPTCREFVLVIPPDRMNDVLWELDLAGLLPVDRLLLGVITLDEINPAFDRLASGQAMRQVIQFLQR